MQVFGLFIHAILFRLIHSQTTMAPAAQIGLLPNSPNYDAGPSGVPTPNDSATTNVAVRDPCGPLNQPVPNPVGDTCNASIIELESPDPYAVQCVVEHTRHPLDFDACATETIPAICDKLANPNVQNATWIWASANAPHVCYMGFYLPPFDGSAQKPDRDKCVTNIFRPMLGYCNPAARTDVSVGTYILGLVNVKVRPDETQNGQAVDVGYPSYIMATRQLTA